ncbi:MAG: hypothetical protein ACREMQ_10475, partial [Longimicrobiales bacterium]
RTAGRLAAWTSPCARATRDTLIPAIMSIPRMRRRALRIAAGYNSREQRYLELLPLAVSSRGT